MARRPHADIRQAALQEAETILRAEGLDAMTARRIAGAAGVSVGTLYNLFGHLDGLVRAVNRRTMARLRAALTAALDGAPTESVEERLIALATAYLDFAEANPALWDALFRHRMQTPPEDATEDEVTALEDVLRRAAGPAVAQDALMALWAAAHGVVELAMNQRLPGDGTDAPRRYLAIIVRAGVRGLTQPGP
ncbi:MAG: TetR/AcrR family transcriptional regulator [Pseudomonadota bacterium]